PFYARRIAGAVLDARAQCCVPGGVKRPVELQLPDILRCRLEPRREVFTGLDAVDREAGGDGEGRWVQAGIIVESADEEARFVFGDGEGERGPGIVAVPAVAECIGRDAVGIEFDRAAQ